MLAFIFIILGLGAHAEQWNPRTPLNYPSSLHSKILTNTSNMKRIYGEDCLLAVKEYLGSGGDFHSNMALKFSLPFENFPRADVADNSFFHWTSKGAKGPFDEMIVKQSYEDLFSYIRNRGGSTDVYDWLFYLAADPKSSQDFGVNLYKFTLKKETLVFFLKGDMPNSSTNLENVNAAIVSEISQRDRSLQKCDIKRDPDAPTLLVALALEATNISLVAYVGVNNEQGTRTKKGPQWLQLVNPWAIESMEFVKAYTPADDE
jgi:hypothetical protein